MRREEAVVLRRLEYSRTSLVLAALGSSGRRVNLLHKGARKSKRKGHLPPAPELFTRGEVLYYEKRGDALGLVAEWSELEPRSGIRKALGRFCSACYVAELALGLTREGEGVPGVFDGLEESLSALETGDEPSSRLVAIAASLKLLGAAGFGPVLDACASCGGEGYGGGFDPSLGGTVCERCSERALPFGAEARAAAVYMSQAGPAAAGRLSLGGEAARELTAALCALAGEVLGRPLKTQRVLERGVN